MAIFHKTSDLLDRANVVQEKVTAAVDEAADIVETLLSIADRLDGMTTRLGKSIESAGEFMDTISDVIKRSPLAQGPLKILLILVAALLSAIATVVKGVGSAVKSLGKAIKRSPLRSLDELAEAMEDKISTYGDISGKVKNILIKLKRLSDKLKEEQDDIEAAIPLLRKTVTSAYLEPIETELGNLENVIDDIEEAVKKIKEDIKKIEEVLEELNPLEELFSEFQDAVSGINDALKKASGKVKDFINGIPGIGWLFDNLDKAFDWALEKLGIKTLFSNMAKGIEDLPFIKKIKELKERIDEIAKRLISQFEATIKEISEAIEALAKNLMSKNATLAIYARIGLTKFNIESWLPEWLSKLISLARSFREKLDEITDDEEQKGQLIEEWKRIAKELKMEKEKVNRAVTEPAIPRFGSSVMIPMQINLAEMDEAIDTIEASLDSEDPSEMLSVLIEASEQLESQLISAQLITTDFLETVVNQPPEFFDELSENLDNLENEVPDVTREYRRLFKNKNLNEIEMSESQ